MALTGYPDGQIRSQPSQFSSNAQSSGLVKCAFGFGAALVKIVNDGPGPIYLDLTGTSNATTSAGYQLSTGDLLTDFYDLDTPVSALSYATSSTLNNARVGAWG